MRASGRSFLLLIFSFLECLRRCSFKEHRAQFCFIEGGTMGTLRKRMIDAMKLRRFSPRTEQSYLAAITALANYYHTPPDQLDFEKIKAYLLHLTVERALSWSTCNVAVSPFRFFYTEVIGWEKVSLPIPPRQKPTTLPEILSCQELER